MSESSTYLYALEVLLGHVEVIERRFKKINKPADFAATEYGIDLLDAIVARLQAVGENIKTIFKTSTVLKDKYPDVKWDNIIRFRDFISHHYEMLDYEIIFQICEVHLPLLKKAIENELKHK